MEHARPALGIQNGTGHGQSQRRNRTDGLNQAWGSSVPRVSSGPFGSSAGAADKSVPAKACVSGSMSCGVPVSESMTHPPIVHEALQFVMKVKRICKGRAPEVARRPDPRCHQARTYAGWRALPSGPAGVPASGRLVRPGVGRVRRPDPPSPWW